MFLCCTERTGTAYYEFEYCKKNWKLKKLVKKGYKFWQPDSLIVSIDDDEQFFSNYMKYLDSPDGQSGFNQFGPNYYTKEHASAILQAILKDKPKDWEILSKWLEKAISDYNGFYFLGI